MKALPDTGRRCVPLGLGDTDTLSRSLPHGGQPGELRAWAVVA